MLDQKTKNPLTEDQIQAQFYKEAYNRYPRIRGLLFSVPNGSTRHILEAMKLKATGLTPGVPDMLLAAPVFTAFEFKTETGRLSADQVKIHNTWLLAGVKVHVCRSANEAMGLLHDLLAKHGWL